MSSTASLINHQFELSMVVDMNYFLNFKRRFDRQIPYGGILEKSALSYSRLYVWDQYFRMLTTPTYLNIRPSMF